MSAHVPQETVHMAQCGASILAHVSALKFLAMLINTSIPTHALAVARHVIAHLDNTGTTKIVLASVLHQPLAAQREPTGVLTNVNANASIRNAQMLTDNHSTSMLKNVHATVLLKNVNLIMKFGTMSTAFAHAALKFAMSDTTGMCIPALASANLTIAQQACTGIKMSATACAKSLIALCLTMLTTLTTLTCKLANANAMLRNAQREHSGMLAVASACCTQLTAQKASSGVGMNNSAFALHKPAKLDTSGILILKTTLDACASASLLSVAKDYSGIFQDACASQSLLTAVQADTGTMFTSTADAFQTTAPISAHQLSLTIMTVSASVLTQVLASTLNTGTTRSAHVSVLNKIALDSANITDGTTSNAAASALSALAQSVNSLTSLSVNVFARNRHAHQVI